MSVTISMLTPAFPGTQRRLHFRFSHQKTSRALPATGGLGDCGRSVFLLQSSIGCLIGTWKTQCSSFLCAAWLYQRARNDPPNDTPFGSSHVSSSAHDATRPLNTAFMIYPDIDPAAIRFGNVAIHWYGLMYVIGIVAGWWLGRMRAKKPNSGWSPDEIADMFFYGALGVMLGGRVGYALFYNLAEWLQDPLMVFRVWQGGMSFHGGMLGVLFAMWLYARKTGRTFFETTDFIAPLVPIGLGAGRIGNFINGELWGRPTDVPWGMIFPHVDGELRHPSMLYQAVLEGVVLFVVLWLFSARPRPRMATSGLFLLCYGMFRFAVEFVRQPDAHIGFVAFGWVTMGHLLSLPMIVFGVLLLMQAYTHSPMAVTVADQTQAGEKKKRKHKARG